LRVTVPDTTLAIFSEKHIHEVPTSPEYAQGFDDGCADGKKSAGDIFRLFSFI